MNGQFGGAKLVKEIHFDEGRQKLIAGIDKLAAAVGSTLGASGRTVIIENDFGGAHVTKDGVTVAESIQVSDPVENLGMTLLKQASKNTASRAGDGTTTSTVLAKAIIDKYSVHPIKASFRDVKIGIEKARDYIIEQLDKKSVKVDDKRIENVSIISANGDKALGKLISDAFRQAGENGIVTHQASGSGDTYVESVDGTHIKSNSASHHFFTNPEKEICELENPLIFLCATKIDNIRKIQDILEYAIKSGKAILLIAPLESQPMAALAMNRVRGNIKVNVIDPPSFGLKRKDILDDIALLTGATVINEELGDALDMIGPDVLGSAERAISDMEGTTLTFTDEPNGLTERIDYLRTTLEEEDHLALIKHLEKRLAILTGGVAIINVGADTEHELKEKQDRVDDAVQAVKAAKKEGILPGGGAALRWISHNHVTKGLTSSELIGWVILTEAILSPFNKILDNAGLKPSDFEFEKWGQGVDVTDGKVKDMRKAGIIDPVLVTKEALKNAVSVALTILSTDAVISNVREV